MWRYFELLSLDKTVGELAQMRERAGSGEVNPRSYKVELAKELVTRFHDRPAANGAEEAFERRFRGRQIPDGIQQINVSSSDPAGLPIANAVKEAQLTKSTSEARRMVKQGAVRVDKSRVEDEQLLLRVGNTYVIQVGKLRFARVTIT